MSDEKDFRRYSLKVQEKTGDNMVKQIFLLIFVLLFFSMIVLHGEEQTNQDKLVMNIQPHGIEYLIGIEMHMIYALMSDNKIIAYNQSDDAIVWQYKVYENIKLFHINVSVNPMYVIVQYVAWSDEMGYEVTVLNKETGELVIKKKIVSELPKVYYKNSEYIIKDDKIIRYKAMGRVCNYVSIIDISSLTVIYEHAGDRVFVWDKYVCIFDDDGRITRVYNIEKSEACKDIIVPKLSISNLTTCIKDYLITIWPIDGEFGVTNNHRITIINNEGRIVSALSTTSGTFLVCKGAFNDKILFSSTGIHDNKTYIYCFNVSKTAWSEGLIRSSQVQFVLPDVYIYANEYNIYIGCIDNLENVHTFSYDGKVNSIVGYESARCIYLNIYNEEIARDVYDVNRYIIVEEGMYKLLCNVVDCVDREKKEGKE